MAGHLAFFSPCHAYLWSPSLGRSWSTATAAPTVASWSLESRPYRPILLPNDLLRDRRKVVLSNASPGLRRDATSMRLEGGRREIPRRKPSFLRGTWRREAYRSAAQALGRDVELAGSLALPLPLPLPWACLQLPVGCAASAAGALLAAGRSVCSRPGSYFFQGFLNSEAILSGAILLAAPVLLRSWAKMEAAHHDTMECRTVLQTYLIAASGCVCAMLAGVAGNHILAVVLQAAWRGVAARSLWTWSDLGRSLDDTPGWLHASVSRWRVTATCLAIFGMAARVLVLLAGGRSLSAVAAALSSPAVGLLPRWMVAAASRTDGQFNLSASQLGLGVGLYVWISYYLCAFLPYRLLYDEYQNFSRRTAQFWRDLDNREERNVVLATELGPSFPKHLSKRMARTPPGDAQNFLRLAGILRQRSCSVRAVKAWTLKKNKKGKYGVKMAPIERGDLRYWGSDLFDRLEQQERRDKETGWKRPEAPGSGMYKYNRLVYSRIMREIKVELGKTDEEMETDPFLSTANLMRFDPQAEEGDFDLVMQKKQGVIDAAGDKIRMQSNGHEMVIMSESTVADKAKESGLAGDAEPAPYEDGSWDGDGSMSRFDNLKVSYRSGNTAGRTLEDSLQSRASGKARPTSDAQKKQGDERSKEDGATDATPSASPTNT